MFTDRLKLRGSRSRLLSLLLALTVSVSVMAQKAKLISVAFDNEKATVALHQVEKKSGKKIQYNYGDLDFRVTLKLQNKTAEQVVNAIITGHQLRAMSKGNYIVIVKGSNLPNGSFESKDGKLQGMVLDPTGEPVIGAVVRDRANKQNTVTDIDGRFALEAASDRITLDISYVGMKNATWSGKRNDYALVLMEDASNTLQDVVVTGYQQLDRRNLTSSVTSKDMEDLMRGGVSDVSKMLEGQIPDLISTAGSGEINATSKIRIRGTSTLIGNREPLWVLDGIQLTDPVDVSTEQLNDPDYINYIGNAISGINPEDIERVDVLKDAAATALYGTRAANGVIVVTTKKGKAGPPHITYSSQLKLVRRPRYTDHNINLMNSEERVQFGKDLVDMHYAFPSNMTMVGYEGAYYNYISGNIGYDEFASQVRQYQTVNTDWFDIISHDALTQTHSLSVSGGGENNRYYASLGYTDEDAVVKTQNNRRYTTAMSIQADLTSSLQVSIKLNGNVQKKDYLPSEVTPLTYAYNTTRALPCYNADGSLFYYQKHAYNLGKKTNSYYKYNYNILNEMENSSQTYDANSLIASLDLVWRHRNILDVDATLSYQRSSSENETWFGEKTNYVATLKNGEYDDSPVTGSGGLCELPYGGVLNIKNSITESLTARLQANYHQAFGAHMVSANLGYEVNTYRNNGFQEYTRGYFKDRGMKYISSMTAEDIASYPLYADWIAENHRTITATKTNKLSGYLTLTYSLKSYFTVNANGRFDASNQFGSRSNEKLLPVWSVSGMFNAKEVLLRKVNAIDDLRWRMSYGKTGNMVDGQTPNLLIQQGSMDSYWGANTSSVYAFPNPNLRWEQTDQWNTGVDASFFGGRLTVGLDAYYKITHDAFTTVPVSTVNGVSTYVMNGGDIKNRGFSISLMGYPVKTKDWSWYLSTNYSYVKNQVESDAVNEYTIDDYLDGTAIIGGEAIGTFYSYKFLGLNPNNGMPMFDDYSDRRHLLEGKSLEDIVKTVLVKSGTRDPKFTGALYSTLRWKQLSLTTSFTYSLGNKIRKYALYSDIIDGVSSESNVRKELLDRWQVPGDEQRTVYPALLSPSNPLYQSYNTHWSNNSSADIQGFKAFATNYWDMYDYSDLRVVSGDYLRLSQLSLRYQFTKALLRKTPFTNITIDMSTTNVFTICSGKLDGQDPSQSGFSANVVLSTRPTYIMKLSFTF